MPLPDAPVPRSAAEERPVRPYLSAPRAVFLAIGIGLMAGGALLWGRPLNASLFHGLNDLGPAAPLLWSLLSVAGLGGAAWIYVGATHVGQPQRVAELLWVIVVGGIAVHLVKHGLATPRPLGQLGADAVHVTGEALRTQSMPSGHSAMAFALLTLMAIGGGAGDARAALASVGWVLLGLGIAASRIAVGAHWPSDVLFGAGMGVVAAVIAPRAWGVAKIARWMSRPLGSRVMAGGFAVAAVAMAVVDTGYPLARALQYALSALALWGAWRWWQAAGSLARRSSAASHPGQ